MQEEKDFFISYHQADHEWAEWIAYQLEAAGYSCIVRAWDFRPGFNSVLETHKALMQTKRVLMILSPDYLDAIEINQAEWAASFAQDPTGSQGLLIPIRIRKCDPSGLLKAIISIDLVDLTGSAALKTLLDGVQRTRLKPSQAPSYPGSIPIFPGPSTVLIASLGDSPVVVSSMYDLLTQQEGLIIDRMIVLYPEGEKDAYKYVKEVLSDVKDLQPKELPFEDANTWRNACIFLKELYTLLNACQEKGDTIYLSLAGGRKSMAALAGWVAPLFPCIKGLYQVIDKREELFLSTADLDTFDVARRYKALHPDLHHLILVKLPFEKGEVERRDFQEIHRGLRTATYDTLSVRGFEAEMASITLQGILQKGPVLKMEMTKQAVDQYQVWCEQNPAYARLIYENIMQMSSIPTLRQQEGISNLDSYKLKYGRSSSVLLHSFTTMDAPVYPVFYTLPKDIYTHSDNQVERVIIYTLEVKSADGYRTPKEIAQTSSFSVKPELDFELLSPPPLPSPTNSILIVPLGKSPMVATQLYTLLTKQEQHTIHEVVLLYPQLSAEIHNGADMIWQALREEYNILCTCRGIPDLEDIVSTADCQLYQAHLESEIERIKHQYPDHKIDLALSGGRKGMTAMTIFAAQNQEIPYVYHTLIPNDEISEEIEYETTIKALDATRLSQNERNDRLFLRAYKAEGYNPYAYFTLFRVPVFNSDGW